MRTTTQEDKDKAKARKQLMLGLCKRLAALPEAEQLELRSKMPCIFNLAGRALSFRNQYLCYMQGMKAPGVVAGFRQWKTVGRTVRKGQHGFSIWIPCRAKREETAEGDMSEQGDSYFILATVFDLSQTCEIETDPESSK